MPLPWLLSVSAQGAVFLRLASLGLLSELPLFATFLAASTARSVFLMSLGAQTPAYARAWLGTEWIMLLLKTLAACETIAKISRLRRIGPWLAVVGFVAGIGFMLATIRYDAGSGLSHPTIREVALLARRTQSALAVSLLACGLYFSQFVRIPIYLRTHLGLLTLFFGGLSACQWLAIQGYDLAACNTASLGISVACSLAWLLILNRPAEHPLLTPRQP